MLEAGIQGETSVIVTEALTAKMVKSGLLPVYATPSLAALIEETAFTSVAKELSEGEGTVGGSLDLKHLAPTVIGEIVTCRTTLVEVAGKKLTFEAEVSDGAGVIGTATHVRFIIDNKIFMEKAEKRRLK